MVGRIYGLGIVGCGVIAPTHVTVARELPNLRLAGVMDIVPERAQALGTKENVPAYSELDELLASPDVDVVSVCVPSGLHAEIGVRAAEAGKHLVVEKPIDVSLEAADRLVAAAAANDVKLTVISQHRFDPGHRRLFDLVQRGALGRLVYGEAFVKWYRTQAYYDSGAWRGTWALDGGGAVMNQGVHYVDLLRWVMGPVADISARCATNAHTGIEVEDIALATIRFESGALGLIDATTVAYPGFSARLEITGTKGTVIVEDGRITTEALQGESEEAAAEESADIGAGADPAALRTASHQAQVTDLLRAVETGSQPLVTGEEGRATLALVRSLYESAGTGGPGAG